MKNKKAFTLIELLAVVILIGLIAVLIIPKIKTTIEDSKKNSGEISVKSLYRIATNYYLEKRGKGSSFDACEMDFENQTNTCEDFEMTGEKPSIGTLAIEKNGNIYINVKIDDYCYIKTPEQEDITITSYNENTCLIER